MPPDEWAEQNIHLWGDVRRRRFCLSRNQTGNHFTSITIAQTEKEENKRNKESKAKVCN